MSFLGFLQRQEIIRQQRKSNRLLQPQESPVVARNATKAPTTATLHITKPDGRYVVEDATDRRITVDVPFTYETISEHGELITVTDKATIELEINLG